MYSVHSGLYRIYEPSGHQSKQQCIPPGNVLKGYGPYIRPKRHIQHTQATTNDKKILTATGWGKQKETRMATIRLSQDRLWSMPLPYGRLLHPRPTLDNAMNIPELSEQDVSTNACLPREPRAPIKRGRNTHQTKGRSASSSEIKIRSMSLSPSRIQSLKGAKFDTPLLKDFLRKQAKHTRTQSDSLSNINIASTQNVPIDDGTQVTNL